MNEIFRIGDYLIQNARTNKSIGLMQGKMGISLYCFMLSKATNRKEYAEYAETLLDDIYKEISVVHKPDFYYGLAGVGWGIEYLVQNNFVEADTDDVLEVVDIIVLKTLTGIDQIDFGLSGYLGYLLYLNQRLKKNKRTSSVPYKLNKELLFFLVNKVDDLCGNHFSKIGTDSSFDLTLDFPVLMIVLEQVYQLEIYNVKIDRMVNQFPPYFETKMPLLNVNKLYLASAINKLIRSVPNFRLKKQVSNLISSLDFDALLEEVSGDIHNLRYGTWGLKYILWQFLLLTSKKDPNWLNAAKFYNSVSNIHEPQLNLKDGDAKQTNIIELGIMDGIAGIGLSKLIFPSVIDISSKSLNLNIF